MFLQIINQRYSDPKLPELKKLQKDLDKSGQKSNSRISACLAR